MINGVFIQETFTVAQHDEFIMVRSRLRQVSQHKDRLTRLFQLADQNDDGFLSRSELKYILEMRAIRTWLEAREQQKQLKYNVSDVRGRVLCWRQAPKRSGHGADAAQGCGEVVWRQQRGRPHSPES